MDTCGSCGKKYPTDYPYDTCKCGGGLINSDDENFLSWLNEYDSDGF